MDVIVHGGAGSRGTADDEGSGEGEGDGSGRREGDGSGRSAGDGSGRSDGEDREAALEAAAVAAAESETPLNAVEVAVRALEHDPRFNAGVGARVQSDGIPRTEAGVATSDGDVGAAAAMPGVEHAVSAARIVLEETPHVLLAGVHAVDLADAFDVEVERDLWTDTTRDAWDEVDQPPQPMHVQAGWVADRWQDSAPEPRSDRDSLPSGDTVGAVARDGDDLAAATSTGGQWCALAGRVGDVPQVGAGFYASDAAAASATGAGEEIARTALARDAVERVEDGAAADAAAESAIEAFGAEVGSRDVTAGVIVADAEGTLGNAYDSDAMPTATERR